MTDRILFAEEKSFYVLRFEDGRYYWEYYGPYDDYRVGFTTDPKKAFQDKPWSLRRKVAYYDDFQGLEYKILHVTEKVTWRLRDD